MSDHMTPFEVAERQIGSMSKIEQVLGYQRTAGYVWQRAAQGRDAGDFSSTRQQRRLLTHCRENGIVLKPEWLIFGATEDEITAEEGRAAVMARAMANCAPFRSSRSPEAAE
jgi:hypothetical protein